MTYRMRVREGVSIARQDRGMLTGGPAPWPSLTVSPARGPGPSLPGRRSWTPALRCLVSTQGSRAPPPGQTLTGLPPLSSAAQRACLRCPIMSVGRPLCSVYDARNACGPGLGREHGGGMSAEAPTPITRPAKLGEIAADRLRERILRGHLAPGSPLSQEMLAREFGISRTPMRDALKLLERDGLIQLDSSGLATVADPKDDDARDLLRIREVIDSVAAQRAAMLAEPLRRELALILQPIVDEMSDAAAAEDRYRFRVADSRFHVAILRRCGLNELDRCQAFVHTTALSMYAVRPPSPGHLAASSRQHGAISAAIVSGDAELSAQRAAEHVRHAYKYYYGTGRRTALSPMPGARDPKLAERIAAAIEADVVRAGWQVGQVLGSEEQLMARYGVGRAVLREAVRLAEHRQIVRPRRGRNGGLVVVEPDQSAVTESLAIFLEYAQADLEDLLEARAVLEAFSAATAAVGRPGGSHLAELNRAAQLWRDCAAPAAHRFHETVAGLSGNAALSLFITAIAALSDRLGIPHPAEDGPRTADPVSHAAIAAAITSGEADQAAARIRREIVDRGWPVGESLGFEADLMARYGIGRAQFREAARILENHSVIGMQRGADGGMVVRAPDGRAVVRAVSLYLTYQGINTSHIRDLRAQLEAAVLQLAIERLTPDGVQRLNDVIERERTWPDSDFPAVSHDLHAVIGELS